MSKIAVDWDNVEQTVVLFKFQNGWGWLDFNDAGEKSYQMLDSVDHPVVQIFDMTESSILPAGSITQGRHALKRDVHPNLHFVILIGMNAYFTALYRIMKQLLPQSIFERWNMHLVSSYDEAYELINSQD